MCRRSSGNRVMRDRGLRLLSMPVIPFSPCSARLNVFLFMAAAFFPARQEALVILDLYLMSFVAAVLTALVFKGRFPSSEPLVLELPLGVEPASSLSLSGRLGTLLAPVLDPIGINPNLTVALLFGFIAKEIVLGGLAVIYGQADPVALGQAIAADVSWPQAVSFMLFTLPYTPCLSTVAVIRSKSKQLGFTVLSVGWSLLLS